MYGIEGKQFKTLEETISHLYKLPHKDYNLDIYVNSEIWRSCAVKYMNGRYIINHLFVSDLFPLLSLLENNTKKQAKQKSTVWEEKKRRALEEIARQKKEMELKNREKELIAQREDEEYKRSLTLGPFLELKRQYYKYFKNLDADEKVHGVFILRLMETQSDLKEDNSNVDKEYEIFNKHLKEMENEIPEPPYEVWNTFDTTTHKFEPIESCYAHIFS